MLQSAGKSILVVDKNITALARLADHHVILKKGQVVWQGDSAALQAGTDRTARYLGVQTWNGFGDAVGRVTEISDV